MKICTPFIAILLLLLYFQATVYADDDHPAVRIKTNTGDMIFELDRTKAPETVKNFLQYVKDGHYEGTIFHRVIDGFMIQGGGFTADFKKKPIREPIKNEADNGLRNRLGTLAMARTNDPHSATSQFFINLADNSFLDFREKKGSAWGYTVFGRIVRGMDTAMIIKNIPTGAGGIFSKDVPRRPIIIEEVTLLNWPARSSEKADSQ